jgi:predicted N-acetyltransferase YhbS
MPCARLPDVPPEYFQALPFGASLPRGVVTYHEAFSEFALSVTQVTKETRP